MGENRSFWAWFSVLMFAFAMCMVMSVFLTIQAHARDKDDAVVVTADPIVYLDIEAGKGHCSGYIIDAVTIGTAAHCTEGSTFVVKDSIGRVYPASPAYVDKIHDLALFKLDGINKFDAQTAVLGCKAPVAVGDDVTSIGYPHNQGKVTVFGKISALASADADGAWPDVYRLQMFASPGSSGGAVFNKEGQVIAIIVGYGNIDPTGLGMIEAVPISDLCHPSVI